MNPEMCDERTLDGLYACTRPKGHPMDTGHMHIGDRESVAWGWKTEPGKPRRRLKGDAVSLAEMDPWFQQQAYRETHP